MAESSTTKKVASGFIWVYGERFLAQLVSFIVSLVLARLLTPSHYGTIALVTVFITICDVLVTGGFGSALVQKKDADDLDFSSVTYASLALALVVAATVFLCAPLIARFYDMPILTSVIRVMTIRIPIAAFNSIQHAYVSKKMQFRRFFFSTLIGTAISAAVGIGLAYAGYGIWAIVGQYMTNCIIDTLVLFVTVKWRPKAMFSFERVKTLFSYGWKILASSLIDVVYNELQTLVIGKRYTESELALYNKGKQFPTFVAYNINSSINNVLFPVMADAQDDLARVKSMTRRAMCASTFLMCPLLFGLGVCAEPIVRVLLTEKWIECVPYLRIMCIVFIFYPLHTANLQAIKALGRSDIILKIEIAKKLCGVVALVCSIVFFDSVLAIAIGQLVTALIATALNAAPNKKLLDYGFFEQIKDILPAFVLATVMGAAVYFVPLLGFGDILSLVIQFFGGAAIYIGLAVLFKLEGWFDFVVMVKSVFSAGAEKLRGNKGVSPTEGEE